MYCLFYTVYWQDLYKSISLNLEYEWTSTKKYSGRLVCGNRMDARPVNRKIISENCSGFSDRYKYTTSRNEVCPPDGQVGHRQEVWTDGSVKTRCHFDVTSI